MYAGSPRCYPHKSKIAKWLIDRPLTRGTAEYLATAPFYPEAHDDAGGNRTGGLVFTPEAIHRLPRNYPQRPLITARMGMSEYAEFLYIFRHFAQARPDTTMTFTFADDDHSISAFPTESAAQSE